MRSQVFSLGQIHLQSDFEVADKFSQVRGDVNLRLNSSKRKDATGWLAVSQQAQRTGDFARASPEAREIAAQRDRVRPRIRSNHFLRRARTVATAAARNSEIRRASRF